jgi:hypothetical protein
MVAVVLFDSNQSGCSYSNPVADILSDSYFFAIEGPIFAKTTPRQ